MHHSELNAMHQKKCPHLATAVVAPVPELPGECYPLVTKGALEEMEGWARDCHCSCCTKESPL